MEKIFTLVYHLDNSMGDDKTMLVKAFATKESAENGLCEFVKDLKANDTLLKEIFNNGTTPILPYEEYHEDNNHFTFVDSNYDVIYEVYIEEVLFINE